MSEAPDNLATSECNCSPYFQASKLGNNPRTSSSSPAASGKLSSRPLNLSTLRNKRPTPVPIPLDPRPEEFLSTGCQQSARASPSIPATAAASAAADGPSMSPVCHQLDAIEQRLSHQLGQLANPPGVAAIYNPIRYAGQVHREYMRRYLPEEVSVLFVGLNPGPWGMCQTGVPFGWVRAVRDWMQLDGGDRIGQPEQLVQRVPVRGFRSERNEVSGQRFWTLMRTVFGPPVEPAIEGDHGWLEEFRGSGCFVYNWCPLAFFTASGQNVTPAELKPPYRSQLERFCNEALVDIVQLLGPDIRVVCIGGYVDRMLRSALRRSNIGPREILKMVHPSPRVVGNQHWISEQRIWLAANGIGPRKGNGSWYDPERPNSLI